MTQLDTILTDLRRRNPDARITAQRRLVLDALLQDEGGHYTCENVTQAVAERGVVLDQSTIYRILQWLKDADVVSQTDLGLGSDVYSLVKEHGHHHLICLQCGHIADLDDAVFERLRRTLRLVYRFSPRIEHFAIFGACQHCQPIDEDEFLDQ